MSVADHENRVTLRKLLLVAVLMFGFAYALVPFYEKICEVTGINNVFKPDAVVLGNTQVDLTRQVVVEFDANIRSDLSWRFTPEVHKITAHPGQIVQVVYKVENTSQRTIVGQAVPSYAPGRAGKYFNKLDCFCFRQQSFAPGESRRMPVVFVLDPAIPGDINTITLSYSFFEVAGARKVGG